jgi:phosphoribosyl 1,2-cyclic phosphodiesterase
MRVTFWGVRGSCPVPGPHTVRYGGNTPCVEVRCGDGTLLILDAGTGIRALGSALQREEFGRGEGIANLLLSHTHHDHMNGLPFFEPLYVAGNRVQLHGPDLPGASLEDVVAGWMASAYHPAPLEALQARVQFHGINAGSQIQIGGATVSVAAVNHTTVANAYRIDADGTSIAYATDTGPFDGALLLPPGARPAGDEAQVLAQMRADFLDLIRGCRLVIYDTMFDNGELAEHPDWGHSSAAQALEMCREAEVSHLVMFHHNPDSSDEEIDARVAAARSRSNGLQVSGAREGETLYLR